MGCGYSKKTITVGSIEYQYKQTPEEGKNPYKSNKISFMSNYTEHERLKTKTLKIKSNDVKDISLISLKDYLKSVNTLTEFQASEIFKQVCLLIKDITLDSEYLTHLYDIKYLYVHEKTEQIKLVVDNEEKVNSKSKGKAKFLYQVFCYVLFGEIDDFGLDHLKGLISDRAIEVYKLLLNAVSSQCNQGNFIEELLASDWLNCSFLNNKKNDLKSIKKKIIFKVLDKENKGYLTMFDLNPYTKKIVAKEKNLSQDEIQEGIERLNKQRFTYHDFESLHSNFIIK